VFACLLLLVQIELLLLLKALLSKGHEALIGWGR
jgi:hypothetical protein